MALRTQHAHQLANFFWRRVAQRPKSDIVADEVTDECGVESTPIGLVSVEVNAAHLLREEIRGFLGIENCHDHITAELAWADSLSNLEGEGNRCGIVVGTGCTDHTVVMGADENRWQRWVLAADHPGEIGEPGPRAALKWECERIAGVKPQTKPLHLLLYPLLGDRMSGMAHATAFRKSETAHERFETMG